MRRSPRPVVGPILIACLVLAGTTGTAAESDAKQFPTLESLSEASDLIVVGRVTAVEPGEPLVDDAGTCASTDATVAISRRLKGEASDRTVTVHYAGDCGPAPVLGRSIPSGTTLFFLVEEPALGEHSTTTRAIVVRTPDGTIAVRKAGDAPFLRAWSGRPFAELVAAADAQTLPATDAIAWSSGVLGRLGLALTSVARLLASWSPH